MENKKEQTQRKAALIFCIFALLILILAVVFSGKQSQPHSQKQTLFTMKSAIVASPGPNQILTPSDPCKEYYGTAQLGDCMKLQNAMDNGAALVHPLLAKITNDNNAISVLNQEAKEWDQCVAAINSNDQADDTYQSDGFVVNPGEQVAIKWADFTNAQNQRYDYVHLKPKSIDLDCVVGGTTNSKTGHSPEDNTIEYYSLCSSSYFCRIYTFPKTYKQGVKENKPV